MTEHFHILKLSAENIKRLSIVEITPDGNVVVLGGGNGNGKSSVLDSIWWALAGTAGITSQPIRKGEKHAKIELQLGNAATGVRLVVTRKFTAANKNGYLKVETPEGMSPREPQQMLNDLLGALTFDPLAFARMPAKEQSALLRSLVTLDVDLPALETKRQAIYDNRTEVNRDASRAKARLASSRAVEGAPAERPETDALIAAMAGASKTNDAINADRRMREQRAAAYTELLAEETRLAGLLAAVQAKLLSAAEELKGYEANPVPPLVDTNTLREKISDAQAGAKLFDMAAERTALETEATTLDASVAGLTADLAAVDKERTDALGRAKMPVEGLAMGNDEVLYRDVPLDQASDAERLLVSTLIAEAMNPKLRVIRLRDGSLLDDDSMAWLTAWAKERDMQIWIERVGDAPDGGLILEDGHIVGQEEMVAEHEAGNGTPLDISGSVDLAVALDVMKTAAKDADLANLGAYNKQARESFKARPDLVADWNKFYLERLKQIQTKGRGKPRK